MANTLTREQTEIQPEPATIKQLAAIYEVSYRTMIVWLKPIRTKLGKRQGYTWTPKQVAIIYDHLGKPTQKN